MLPICARETIMSGAIRQLGLGRGLSWLPTLSTPFSSQMLRESVAALLPPEPAPQPTVDVAEALKAGWLELWYQPKIDARSLTPCGAEALVRLRHPSWGVVAPAAFLPDRNDPHFRALSKFVIASCNRGLARSAAAARAGRPVDQPVGELPAKSAGGG